MSNVNLVIICLAFAVAALLIVSVVNTRQTRNRLINQKLHQLRRKVAEQDDIATALEALTGSASLAGMIVEEKIDTLQGMLQLAPSDQALAINLDASVNKLEELNSGNYSSSLNRLLNSDSAIAQAQYQLNEAGRIIKKRQAQGKLELSQMTAYISELSWANLMVEVVSLTGQGHKAKKRGDIMRAQAFYKKAQQSALESTLSDDRRHRWVKELSEIMSNNATSISVDLMPETTHNSVAKKASQAAS